MVVSSETPLIDSASFGEPALRLLLEQALDEREEDFLLLRARLVEEGDVALLGAQAEMDQHGGVAAVVEDHVRHAAAMPVEQLGGVVPVLLQGLALIGEDRDAGGGDGGGGVVLGRVDVAGDPADVGAESLQGLDQHRRLDGHVERAGDAGALQGLLRAVFLADGHEARHLGLGDRDLLAAEIGEADVLDDVILRHGWPLALAPVSRVNWRGLYQRAARRGNQDIKMSLYVSAIYSSSPNRLARRSSMACEAGGRRPGPWR